MLSHPLSISVRQNLSREKKMDDMDDTDDIDNEFAAMSTQELMDRTRLLQNEINIMRSESRILRHEMKLKKEKIAENEDKIKMSKNLPHLVANVIEIMDQKPEPDDGEDTVTDLTASSGCKGAIVKTSTRQTIFLPMIGLIDEDKLRPGDAVSINKDSYLILDKLPVEYDSRLKTMEVLERPTERYCDIGGLDKQIQELVEVVVLPIKEKEKFVNLGIEPSKGVLLYGPPGTGKTMMARACAAQTNSTFLKLAAPQLVQMFIGDGAKMIKDAFAMAKQKAPTIIFIDEIDAIGTRRFNSDRAGDREVQRTMLALLNHLDGFTPDSDIKVIAATNRIDILDPALLRSGRLDRKIELPYPNEEARTKIMMLHSRNMTVDQDVNFDELARSTHDFNGAQCRAVCVEAGMIALRRGAAVIMHEDYVEAVVEVQAKKKANINYYS